MSLKGAPNLSDASVLGAKAELDAVVRVLLRTLKAMVGECERIESNGESNQACYQGMAYAVQRIRSAAMKGENDDTE